MRLFYLVLLAVLAACAAPDPPVSDQLTAGRVDAHDTASAADPAGKADAGEADSFRAFPVSGHYASGWEASSFTPCGETASYWLYAESAVNASLSARYDELTDEPYEVVFLRMRGSEEPPATDGFAADYKGLVQVREVLDMRRAGEKDCNGHSTDLGQVVSDKSELHPVEQKLAQCQTREGTTGQGLAICLDQAARDWDAELNRQYQLLLSRADGSEASVRAAQRLWVAHRDAEYAAMDSLLGSGGGSSGVTLLLELRIDLVKDRALQLARINGNWT